MTQVYPPQSLRRLCEGGVRSCFRLAALLSPLLPELRGLLRYFRCSRRHCLSVRQTPARLLLQSPAVTSWASCASFNGLCACSLRQILFPPHRSGSLRRSSVVQHRCKRMAAHAVLLLFYFSSFLLHRLPGILYFFAMTLLLSGVSCAGVFFSSLTISPSINVMILSA